MASYAPFPIPLPSPWIVGRGGPEMYFTNDRGFHGIESAVVILDGWPPRVVKRRGGASGAARSPSGRWIVHGYDGDEAALTFRLRTYARGDDVEPVREETAPLPPAPGDDWPVEEVLFVGERALLVPRECGRGDRRRPWVERDGGWAEEASLPGYARPDDDEDAEPTAFTLTLAEGGEVLVWDGFCFEHDGRGFARTFERRLDTAWSHDWSWAPAGSDGFFYLEGGTRLVEVHRGDRPPRAHLPGLSFYAVCAGPGGTLALLLHNCKRVLLYDPAEETLAEVPADLLPSKRIMSHVVWSEAGFLVTGGFQRDVPYTLDALPRAELDALPRRPVAAAEKPDPHRGLRARSSARA